MARVSADGTASAPAEAAAESDEGWSVAAQGSGATGAPLTSRTTTVSDPLTMALLAEVARSSRTVDFDPSQLAEAQREAEGAALDKDASPAVHPNVKRR